jgi:hypothetical protein
MNIDDIDQEVAKVMGRGHYDHHQTMDVRRGSQPNIYDRSVNNTTMAFEPSASGLINNRYNPRRVDRSTDNSLYLDDLANNMD